MVDYYFDICGPKPLKNRTICPVFKCLDHLNTRLYKVWYSDESIRYSDVRYSDGYCILMNHLIIVPRIVLTIICNADAIWLSDSVVSSEELRRRAILADMHFFRCTTVQQKNRQLDITFDSLTCLNKYTNTILSYFITCGNISPHLLTI